MQPLTLELGAPNVTGFKSIGHVRWDNIPKFAVLTGINGSGKTQLLQAIAYRLVYPKNNSSFLSGVELPISILGDTINPEDVAYLPSTAKTFNIEGSSVSNIISVKQNFLQRLTSQNVSNNIEDQILRERVRTKFGIDVRSQNISKSDLDRLPDDFMYMLGYTDVASALSHVFVSYQVRRAEMLMDHKSEENVIKELGRAPWEFVNDALAAAEFEYRLVPPDNKLRTSYHVRVKSERVGKYLELNDLSSGEQIILRTLLWFYNSKTNNLFPRLFLLDEPDAHLHPSMTRQFIDTLKNSLSDQYNVRIILTTHSPSTVALAPDDSIFVMSREQPRIRRPQSKAEAIGLLTSGLVIVSAGTKFVIVEDEEDVGFFEAVRDVLAEQGPNKDKRALKPAPSLVFIRASIGKGKAKIAGGKTVVPQWMEKFDTPPLNEIFRGVIDLDDGNKGSERVWVLDRYSIENYQLDPLVVFGVLIDERKAPAIRGISIAQGDEHLLRSLGASEVQQVVDHVVGEVAVRLGKLSPEDQNRSSVSFTNGVEVQYPNWMLKRRGHDLLPIFQQAFGQQIITRPKLQKSFRRVRLVPSELANILAAIQVS